MGLGNTSVTVEPSFQGILFPLLIALSDLAYVVVEVNAHVEGFMALGSN